ncbi:MAG: hypothetical protein U0746_15415 [Gemmataceae bacterium]
MAIPLDALQRAKPWPADRRAALPTLPLEKRFAGPLDGVPRVYFNAAKNAATEMPEEVVRSYLADPWLYNDWVWCTGANDNVRQSDLVWADTGETLSDYFARLKAEKPRPGPAGWQAIVPPVVLTLIGGLVGQFTMNSSPNGGVIGAGIGLLLGLMLVLILRAGVR